MSTTNTKIQGIHATTSQTNTIGHASICEPKPGWGCRMRAIFLCSSICAMVLGLDTSSSRQDMYGPRVAPWGTTPPGPTMARVQTVDPGPRYTGATLSAPLRTSAARRWA